MFCRGPQLCKPDAASKHQAQLLRCRVSCLLSVHLRLFGCVTWKDYLGLFESCGSRNMSFDRLGQSGYPEFQNGVPFKMAMIE
jgi:hypothetical protein